jgi:hypothetical protein
MGKPVGVLVRTADELAAVRDVIRFRSPGKFTVAIFLDEQLPARQHLAQVGRSMCADECLFFVQ